MSRQRNYALMIKDFQRFRVGVCTNSSTVRTLQIVSGFLSFHYSHQQLMNPASVLAYTDHDVCYRCISLIIIGLVNKHKNIIIFRGRVCLHECRCFLGEMQCDSVIIQAGCCCTQPCEVGLNSAGCDWK